MYLPDVDMFKKSMDYGQAGDNVGELLRGIKRDDVKRGQVLAQPGTLKTYKKFKAEVYVFKQNEGGRHTPFFNNYRSVVAWHDMSWWDALGVCGIALVYMFVCLCARDECFILWNLIIGFYMKSKLFLMHLVTYALLNNACLSSHYSICLTCQSSFVNATIVMIHHIAFTC